MPCFSDVYDEGLNSKNNRIREEQPLAVRLGLLFVVKKLRLDAMKEEEPKAREKKYETAVWLVNTIRLAPFAKPRKLSSAMQMLCLLELSICCSGIPEASLALGYAQRAECMFKELKTSSLPKKKDIKKAIEDYIRFCIGEAERIGRDSAKALSSFQEIVSNHEHDRENCRTFPSSRLSTIIQARRYIATILVDKGRGTEAINQLDIAQELLKSDHLFDGDWRKHDCELVKASAFLDQKHFKEAKHNLDGIIKQKRELKGAFIIRKAQLTRIDCQIEERGRSIDLNGGRKNGENAEDWIKKTIKVTTEVGLTTELNKLMEGCVERRDRGNFYYANRLFARYLKQNRLWLKKQVDGLELRKPLLKDVKDREKQIEEIELNRYLKLCLEDRIMKPTSPLDRLNEFHSLDSKSLDELLIEVRDSETRTIAKDAIRGFGNEILLKDFLNLYQKRKSKNPSIIHAIQSALTEIYKQGGEPEKADAMTRQKEKISILPVDLTSARDFFDKYFMPGNIEIPEESDKLKYMYLKPHTVDRTMYLNAEAFIDKLLLSSRQVLPTPTDDISAFITVLRRWNSFTPSLASTVDPSKGGGFFLYMKRRELQKYMPSSDNQKTSIGVVIDPGYDFLENFFSEGFSIADIDYVVISHNHGDHTDSLPQLLALFHEMNDRLRDWKPCYRSKFGKKNIKFIVSRGVFETFEQHFHMAQEAIEDTWVLEEINNKTADVASFGNLEFSIDPIPTDHEALGKSRSYGFNFIMRNSERDIFRFGYTGDAKWTPEISEKFAKCDVVCANLGSVVEIFKNKRLLKEGSIEEHSSNRNLLGNKRQIEKGIRQQVKDCKHLYLSGMTLLVKQIMDKEKIKAVIISEFGEELKSGLRIDLFHKFDDWLKDESTNRAGNNKPRCFPGDVGLRVGLPDGQVYCHHCDQFVNRAAISPLAHGFQEAIFFVCDECRSVFSEQQINERLEELYLKGRQLKVGHPRPECIGEVCSHSDLCPSAE